MSSVIYLSQPSAMQVSTYVASYFSQNNVYNLPLGTRHTLSMKIGLDVGHVYHLLHLITL